MYNKPIILENAVQRIGNDKKIFRYDYTRDINVIEINGVTIPFIEMNKSLNECVTITRVSRECDDEEFSCSELYTKTEVSRERDDEEISLSELLTKTSAGREGDDEEFSFLELESKTFVERERDDEEGINFN